MSSDVRTEQQVWEIQEEARGHWQVNTSNGFITIKGEVSVGNLSATPILMVALQPLIGETLQLRLEILKSPGATLPMVTTKKVVFKLHDCPGISRITIGGTLIAVSRAAENVPQ